MLERVPLCRMACATAAGGGTGAMEGEAGATAGTATGGADAFAGGALGTEALPLALGALAGLALPGGTRGAVSSSIPGEGMGGAAKALGAMAVGEVGRLGAWALVVEDAATPLLGAASSRLPGAWGWGDGGETAAELGTGALAYLVHGSCCKHHMKVKPRTLFQFVLQSKASTLLASLALPDVLEELLGGANAELWTLANLC